MQPGDTVEVMNGTDTAPGAAMFGHYHQWYRERPHHLRGRPRTDACHQQLGRLAGHRHSASYINIEGFTIVGDAANYNLQSALAGYSTGNASLDGQGIYIQPGTSVPVPNHITIENNTVYNEPGGGIATNGADYLQILNNVVYDNAHWSAFGNSGISIFQSANSVLNPGIHDTISGNLVYGNAQLVPRVAPAQSPMVRVSSWTPIPTSLAKCLSKTTRPTATAAPALSQIGSQRSHHR